LLLQKLPEHRGLMRK